MSAEHDALLKEVEAQRRALSFIAMMAMTALQTAIGPLDETRRQMLWEIRKACFGEIPSWWTPEEFK